MMAGRASLCLVPCHANGSDGSDICLPSKAACALSCLALEHNQTCVEAASKDHVAAHSQVPIKNKVGTASAVFNTVKATISLHAAIYWFKGHACCNQTA